MTQEPWLVVLGTGTCFLLYAAFMGLLITVLESQHQREATTAQPARAYSPNRSGYVYLIRGIRGTYKIEKTADIKNRRRTFEVKLPFEIEFEHVIQCADRHAAETTLKRRYAHRRSEGTEWFALTDDDVDAIKAIKEM